MKYVISVLRQARGSEERYVESFDYESGSGETTLLQALLDINEKHGANIAFEYSCCQKKCGACSARVNNRPKLLCHARLKDYGGKILIEPLRKFPIVEDLIVDRSILQENLKKLELWLRKPARQSSGELSFRSSSCIQCGLCLEACPNFDGKSLYFGPSSIAPIAKIALEGDEETKAKLKKAYQEHIYKGCGRSLACVNVCPRKIPIDELLVNLNGLSIWKK